MPIRVFQIIEYRRYSMNTCPYPKRARLVDRDRRGPRERFLRRNHEKE